jgi:hypothetical protein
LGSGWWFRWAVRSVVWGLAVLYKSGESREKREDMRFNGCCGSVEEKVDSVIISYGDDGGCVA